MRPKGTRTWIAILALLSAAPVLVSAETEVSPAGELYRIDEPALRSRVIRTVSPVIPGTFRPNAPAVTVAQVELSPNGTLLAVEILEAPTIEVARAVRAALRSWTFGPLGETRVRYVGKLTFYIVARDKAIHVLSPDEVFSSETLSADARKSASEAWLSKQGD